MSRKLENAKRLYLEGIRDGQVDVVRRYTGSRYTQHSTGVADGPEGFIEFFEGFLQRTSQRDIRVIRAIADGNFVFLHVYQDIDDGSARWVTTDMFDTDEEDRIIEHWDVIAAYQEPEEVVSGNDMILGGFEITDTAHTETNKALLRRYLVDVYQNGDHHTLDQYVSNDSYTEHDPEREDGIDALKAALESDAPVYDFVFKVLGQGDHVVSYSKVRSSGEDLAVFDIFRIEDGRIVEHWVNKEPIPPRSEWANTGKF